jgi:NAD(P)-dependent dehydrogenase (short-subunit alcohol dehydrogenase family)
MPDILRPPQGPCYPDLKGKSALVTGGGSGIGRGICLRLAREGMCVFLCGRTEKPLQETAVLGRAQGGLAVPIVADLSRPEQIERLFQRLYAECESLDLLVHNAAIKGGGPLQTNDWDKWRTYMATNLDSCFLLTKKACETMIPRKSGCIIFISSVGGLRAHYDQVAYDTSKSGIDGFTRAAGIELAQHGIRVNGVAPGAISIRAASFNKEIPLERLANRNVSLGRAGVPAEIAACVAFLASAQAEYIVGQTMYVDGGMTAQLHPPSAPV